MTEGSTGRTQVSNNACAIWRCGSLRKYSAFEGHAEFFRFALPSAHAHTHASMEFKRNGILKIESPRLALYARAHRRITKARGAISFICNKTGASGATHITDALSSLFGKAELFSILRHFALSINHPRACLPHALFPFLSFALILSWHSG